MTKGKWCLPAAGMLSSLYTNLNVVNNTLSNIGGILLMNEKEYIWSSSERSLDYTWVFTDDNTIWPGGIRYFIKSADVAVRPVIEF